MPTIYIGSDHAGFLMKKEIVEILKSVGKDFDFDIKDLGCYSVESCDYPEFAFRVARNVKTEEGSFGVLLCGTGMGMSIAANKIKGAPFLTLACTPLKIAFPTAIPIAPPINLKS